MKSRRLWQIFFVLAGLAALGWTFRSVPLSAVWETLRRLSPASLLLLAALNGLLWLLFGLRGWLLARALGLNLSLRRQVAYRLAAFSVSYFTPGTQFGGEPLHVHFLRRWHGFSGSQAVAVVGVDKMLEFSVNFAFLAAGLSWALLSGRPFLSAWWLALPLTLAALPLAWLLALRRGWRLPLRLSWLAQAEAQAAALPAGTLYRALAVSLLSWGLLIAEYALMLYALGFRLSGQEVILSLTAARLAFLVPTPGGLGALEAGQMWALTQLGYPPAAGLSLSLLIRGRDLLFGSLGLVLLWKNV